MDVDYLLSRWVKLERLKCELSQAEVAKRLRFSGRSVVSRMEANQRVITFNEFIELCKIYDKVPFIEVAKLLDSDTDPFKRD